ncbi:type III toxin-antitoxin system ToxN/AbiQ family toxin [Candidatus Pseudoruminococcus sp.]|uniref:type III toxin-antitoxin system ToxN/AbiQ family toxin n=1 Tax=Candidatus Pseudoruminococcus sp. TaxID=3101048 RepID=UPI003999B1DF
MEVYFYYIKEDYVDFLKKYETAKRGFTCVPNAQYWNTNKFTFGAVLEVSGEEYFVPVSSYDKKQQDVILITDKNPRNKGNKVLGSLRLAYMIPVPKSCIIKVDINKMPTEYSRVHVSKELAFCRRNRDKIQKQAQKTYNRVVSKQFPELTRNSCDFKLLEQAYVVYCQEQGIEIPKDLKEQNLNQVTARHKSELGSEPPISNNQSVSQQNRQEPFYIGKKAILDYKPSSKQQEPESSQEKSERNYRNKNNIE